MSPHPSYENPWVDFLQVLRLHATDDQKVTISNMNHFNVGDILVGNYHVGDRFDNGCHQ